MWVLLLVACGEDTSPSTPATPGTANSTDALTSPWVGPTPTGVWLLNLAVAPLGGLAVPFQIETTGAAGVLDTVTIRGVSLVAEVSDDLTTVGPIVIDETGAFVVAIDELLIPGAYTITGSDVTVDFTLHAAVSADGTFCGTVDGEITSMGLPLTGSTFGASTWDGDIDGPTGCGGTTVPTIPRIETCPTLTDGENTGFLSGGELRDFEVVLPEPYDPAVAWPLVFAFHGLGGTPASLLDGSSDLRPYASERGVILIVPQGLDSNGSTLWDTFGTPDTNVDIVLFDDLLTCASATWTVDPDRVYATGMSFGGLMTGALLSHRADVLAAAAPLSGGILTPFAPTAAPPTLVVWGGETDIEVEQDFHLLANDMIDMLTTNGQYVVACNHGLGHSLSSDFWPWVMDFLGDHSRGIAPEPYLGGLPLSFPDYCTAP